LAEDAFGDGERDALVGVDALPGVEVGFGIIGGEGAVEGDVVFDDVEPVALGVGEAVGLLVEPVLVALFDEFGEGRQGLVLGIDGVADEGDEVGEDFGGRRGRSRVLEGFVGLPDGCWGEVVGRLAEGFAQLGDGLVGESAAGAVVVDDLEGGEAVAVFGEELREVGDGFLRGDGLGSANEFVLAQDVDEDGRVAAEVEDLLAEGVAGEGGEDLFSCVGGFRGRGVFAEIGDLAGPAGEGLAEGLLDGGDVLRAGAIGESDEATGEGGEVVGLAAFAGADAFDEVFEGDGLASVGGRDGEFFGFLDADGIEDDEVGFLVVRGVGGDVGEVGGFDAAAAAAFHLVVEEGRADVAQEDEAFERLDVDAGGDHVDGDGDAELGLGAEVLNEVLGFDGAGGGLVGDLAAEGVAFVKHIATDADDAVGVGVGLGEDEGLGHPLAAAAGEEGLI